MVASRFVVLFTICLSFNFKLVAQTAPKIIPPSPDAASLGKFGEYPVSYNTGTPSINIPLHEIVSHDIRYPISLSYHAGGVRVDEIASWVGLGFALTADGVITRSMRGRPDESSPYGYFDSGQWEMWASYKDITPAAPPATDPTGKFEPKHYFQMQVTTGARDLQSDIFSFNFGGRSGKIIFQQDKKPVIIPYQEMHIASAFDEGAQGWVITTPDGIQYTFLNSDAELTTPLNIGQNYSPYYSTWHLSSVRSLKSPGLITFQYENLYLGGFESQSPTSGIIIPKPEQPDPNCNADPPYSTSTGSNEYSINTKVLQRITYADGYVMLTSTDGREDGYLSSTFNGKKLVNVNVVAGTYPSSDVLKSWAFEYDYGNGQTKRLRLTSLKETGKPAYVFSYSSLGLPAIGSYSKDHWGFFNGAHHNVSLMPALQGENAAYFQTNLVNATRESSVNALAGSLNKIEYPTGGYTKFNFEANQVYGTSYSEIVHQVTSTGGQLNPAMNADEQGMYDFYISQQYAYDGGPIHVKSVTFTLTEAKNVRLSVTRSHTSGGPILAIAETNLYQSPINFYNLPIKQNYQGWVYLQPGTYVLLASASSGAVTVSGDVSIPHSTEGNKLVGGIRVASIENFDGTNTYTKYFNYNFPNGQSSADLFTQPVYNEMTPCGHLYISAYDLQGFLRPGGSHIGYKQVEVTEGNGSIGKSVYQYENSSDETMRDQLIKEMHFNSNGDTVRRVTYKYDPPFLFYRNSKSIAMKQSYRHFQSSINGTVAFDFYEFAVTEKQESSAFRYPTRTIERIFDLDDESKYLETITETKSGKEVIGSYFESHALPVSVRKSRSDGAVQFEESIISTETGGVNQLIKLPTIQYGGKEANGTKYLTSAMRTSYVDNVPVQVEVGEHLAPPTFPASAPVPASTPTINFKSRLLTTYNEDKLLTKSQPVNGIVTSYLWSTNKTYPIAQIVNSEITHCAYTSFEHGTPEGQWSFTAGGIVDTDARTGSKCFRYASTPITRTVPSGKIYRVTVWAKAGTPALNGQLMTAQTSPVDGWQLFSATTNNTTTSISITAGWANTLLDELRVHPVDAQMTTFTLSAGRGLTSITDANNVSTFYKYGENTSVVTALTRILDQNGHMLKYFRYRYQGDTTIDLPSQQ